MPVLETQLPFQPRAFLSDHTLIRLLEEELSQHVGVVLVQEVGHLHERAAAF